MASATVYNQTQLAEPIDSQSFFPGFGPSAKAVAEWRTPSQMPLDIVALCTDEAHAVRLSLDYAKRRFGYRQADIADLMGVHKARLSQWRRAEHPMPEKHRRFFTHATGCNLLLQHVEDVEARKKATGQWTERERDDAIVALMTRRVA